MSARRDRNYDERPMNDNRIGFQAAVIGLMSGIFVFILKIVVDLLSPHHEDISTFIIPLIFGLSVSIATYSLRIWYRLSEIYANINTITSDTSEIIKACVVASAENNLRHRAENYSGIAGAVAQSYIAHYFKAISAKEDLFGIDTTNLAIVFMNILWDELIIAQSRLDRSEPSETIVVDIVHTDDVAFWKRNDAARLLERQRRFIDAGGQVNRIIQGRVPVECLSLQSNEADTDRDYIDTCKQVMNNMLDNGINVSYVQTPEGAVRQDFSIVRLQSALKTEDIAVKWYVNKSTIEYCDFIVPSGSSRYILSEILSEWNSLKAKAEWHGIEWKRIEQNEEDQS